MRWSRPSSGSGRTRRRSRFSISRSAIRPWARAPSWSRPAARSRRRLVAAWARWPETKPIIPAGRGRGAACPPPRRAALPLRRRQEPARDRSRQAVAVARDAGARPRVHLPRSRAEIGRQPGRADAGADRGGALGHVEARPAAVPAAGEGARRRGDEGPRRNPGRARRHRARHPGGSGIAHWKRG